MQQESLFSQKEEVSDGVLLKYDDPKRLLRFSVEASGIPIKQVAYDMGEDEKQLIRCLSHNPHDNRHFPFEHIEKLMDVTGNEFPLRWLALRRGYTLVRLKSALEMENEQLRAELLRQEEKFATIQNFVKGLKL